MPFPNNKEGWQFSQLSYLENQKHTLILDIKFYQVGKDGWEERYQEELLRDWEQLGFGICTTPELRGLGYRDEKQSPLAGHVTGGLTLSISSNFYKIRSL